MKTLISVWLALLLGSRAEETIVADTKHNQIEQMADNERALRQDIAVNITETDELLIDFSKLPDAKVKELAKSNVIHVSDPQREEFWATWNPVETKFRLTPKNLTSHKPDRAFQGFKPGTYAIAAGKKTTEQFIIPWVILLKVTANRENAEQSGSAAEDVYLQSGVSATSREWRAADYKNLVALVVGKKVPLPNLADDAGAKVLKRFCSIENLSFGRNKTLPLAARMQDMMEIQPSVSTLAKLYANEAMKGAKVGNESALLMGFLLDSESLQIELVDEYVPTIKHDSEYDYRMTALQEMKSGLATVFVGAYSSVSDDVLFSDENRSDILASIARNALRFSTALSADVRTEMTLKFTKLNEKMKEPRDREAIAKILAALKG